MNGGRSPKRQSVVAAVVVIVAAVLIVGAAGAGAASAQEDDGLIGEADVPDAVGVGESFTVRAADLGDDVVDACWRFDEEDECRAAETTTSFSEPGAHTATLILSDDDGNTNAITRRIVATPAPDASLEAPDSAVVDETVTLDASASTDDYEATYLWDVTGDGEIDSETDDPTVAHAYSRTGEYEITVTVVDAADQADEAVVNVAVQTDDSGSTDAATDGSTDTDGEEGTVGESDGLPGFGFAVAIVGVLASCALLIRRRA